MLLRGQQHAVGLTRHRRRRSHGRSCKHRLWDKGGQGSAPNARPGTANMAQLWQAADGWRAPGVRLLGGYILLLFKQAGSELTRRPRGCRTSRSHPGSRRHRRHSCNDRKAGSLQGSAGCICRCQRCAARMAIAACPAFNPHIGCLQPQSQAAASWHPHPPPPP